MCSSNLNNGASTTTGAATSKFLNSLTNNSHTVSVPLSASVTVDIIVLAVILAIAGGLIAGSLGGWRAARPGPAAALAKVE